MDLKEIDLEVINWINLAHAVNHFRAIVKA